MILSDGIINLYEDEVLVSDLTANSNWITGSINGKVNLADFVVHNDGTEKELHKNIEGLVKKLI